MEWLRISNLAIGSLPTGVLVWVLTIFLLSIKKKSLSTWMLIVYFGVLSLLTLSYILRYSILLTIVFHTGQLSNLIVFGIVSYILFAYLFQENFHPLESKIVTILFSAAALYVYFSIFWIYPELEKTYDFSAHYFTFVYGSGVSIVTGLGYFWIIVIFLRKTILTSEYSGPLTTWLQRPHSIRYLTGSLLISLVKMFRPRGKKAKSHHAFALLTLATFSISFLYLLMSARVISRETYGYFFNSVGLLTTFAIFIVYTNNTFEPSSFRWKLVGLSFAPIMVILGIACSIILSFADTSFDNQRALEVESIKSMLFSQETSDLPLNIVYVASRPKRGGPYSSNYVLEKSSREDIQATDFIDSDKIERDKELSKTVDALIKKDKYFNRKQARIIAGNEIDSQVPPEQKRRFRYFNLSDPNSFYIHYDFSYGIHLYEIGYSYKWYRREIHKTALKLVYIIIGATILILILFPVFFYRNLFKIDLHIF